MVKKSNTKPIITIIVIIAAAYYAYTHFLPSHGNGGDMGGAPPVGVAEVIERDIRQWSEFSGKLVAVEQVEIRPRISGTIESIHFTDGQMVAKGDLLFVIDPRPYEAALQSANAAWVLADSDLKRAKSLIESKAIPQRDYDQRKNAAEVAKANLTRAKLDLEYTQVKSPISGRASRAEITVGNLVEAGSSAPVLTSVVSSTPIYADFEIDEANYLKYARAGVTGSDKAKNIPVILELDGMTRQGYVASFDNQSNATSGTVRVRAVFDNNDGVLVSGLFARLKMGSPENIKSVLITDRAIGTEQNKKYVLVVGENNATERRYIKLGGTAENLRIVEEGLKAGEKIVVSGLQRVMMPNQPVTPEMVAMDKVETESQAPTAKDENTKE